jgi:hypothetical protein
LADAPIKSVAPGGVCCSLRERRRLSLPAQPPRPRLPLRTDEGESPRAPRVPPLSTEEAQGACPLRTRDTSVRRFPRAPPFHRPQAPAGSPPPIPPYQPRARRRRRTSTAASRPRPAAAAIMGASPAAPSTRALRHTAAAPADAACASCPPPRHTHSIHIHCTPDNGQPRRRPADRASGSRICRDQMPQYIDSSVCGDGEARHRPGRGWCGSERGTSRAGVSTPPSLSAPPPPPLSLSSLSSAGRPSPRPARDGAMAKGRRRVRVDSSVARRNVFRGEAVGARAQQKGWRNAGRTVGESDLDRIEEEIVGHHRQRSRKVAAVRILPTSTAADRFGHSRSEVIRAIRFAHRLAILRRRCSDLGAGYLTGRQSWGTERNTRTLRRVQSPGS